jgi:hypothetical protein
MQRGNLRYTIMETICIVSEFIQGAAFIFLELFVVRRGQTRNLLKLLAYVGNTAIVQHIGNFAE